MKTIKRCVVFLSLTALSCAHKETDTRSAEAVSYGPAPYDTAATDSFSAGVNPAAVLQRITKSRMPADTVRKANDTLSEPKTKTDAEKKQEKDPARNTAPIKETKQKTEKTVPEKIPAEKEAPKTP